MFQLDELGFPIGIAVDCYSSWRSRPTPWYWEAKPHTLSSIWRPKCSKNYAQKRMHLGNNAIGLPLFLHHKLLLYRQPRGFWRIIGVAHSNGMLGMCLLADFDNSPTRPAVMPLFSICRQMGIGSITWMINRAMK